MDGYTATRRIRERAEWASLPVLAMTANVMAEDRARAREAGMSDHIAKPVLRRALYAALLTWIPAGERVFDEDPELRIRPPDDIVLPTALPGIDLPRALQTVGANRTLLRKLLGDFLADHGTDGERIRAAVAQADVEGAQRIAHTLKGIAGALGATSLQRAAAMLEAAIKERKRERVEALMVDVERELAPIVAGLSQWLDVNEREVPMPASIDADTLRAELRALETLLREMSPDAGPLAERIVSALGRRDDVGSRLVKLAMEFEFEAALECLAQVRKDHP
jgi:HPt (histidine-containing phosphotransfer) domain-containing protein